MAFPNYGAPSPTAPNQDKAPQLGQLMQSILGKGPRSRPGEAPGNPEPGTAPADMPATHPLDQPMPGINTPPMIPGVPPMPGPGGPLQGAGRQISPEEYQAILEQIKGELAKSISGQSGQQDRMFAASAGLSRYRPMQGFQMGQPPQPGMTGMPQDAQFPPGMDAAGLDRYRNTGNPNPGMGLPPSPVPQLPMPRPMPPQIPPTGYGPYTR